MQSVNIAVNLADRGYEATVNADHDEALGIGTSPDEALGCLVRELWLGGWFDNPVQVNIEINS